MPTALSDKRQAIVDAALALDRSKLNRGTTGNLSLRDGDHMLITPSAVPSDALAADMVARMPLAGNGPWEGPRKPSSEWRFHRDILRARPDIDAVVHTHAPFCTVLSIARRPIPAIHYMIAAFGGPDIRVADYATFGTAALSDHVLRAMEGRMGCLMANHGMVVGGPNLPRALWLAHELEALAHQHYHAQLLGGAHVLTDAEVAETAAVFAGYGVQGDPNTA
ncbi:class II aldolase/adducin family protein [Meridianimarinicoccus sp. RP-17]|uniref:class II aldolase/adducin family protein n=1 Tax=Meridianimarinicoccus zhengii TaxID=2056810 RepID=UPI000DAE9036|nr:class II aldolase/adducin family protein [Phycocomes zhengii]